MVLFGQCFILITLEPGSPPFPTPLVLVLPSPSSFPSFLSRNICRSLLLAEQNLDERNTMETESGEGRQAGSPATFRLLPALADFIFLWLNLGQQHAAGWRMPLQEKTQDDQSQKPRKLGCRRRACDLGLPSGAQGEMGWGWGWFCSFSGQELTPAFFPWRL